MTEPVPGPRGKFIYGSLREYRRAPLDLFLEAVRTYGDVVLLRMGPAKVFLFNHPDFIKHILQTAVGNYKKSSNYRQMRHLLGDGLITSEGETWRRNRSLAQPAFHRKSLEALSATMAQCIDGMLDRWEGWAREGTVFDLFEEMLRVTMEIVSKCLLGSDVMSRAGEVNQSLSHALDYIFYRMDLPFPPPTFLPTRTQRRFDRARAVLDQVMFEMIARGREAREERHDLLWMLIQARDEQTGEGLSDAELRDELMTLFLAGYETTATALTWTFYQLSRHPYVRRRLEEEVDASPGDTAPLPYTQMTIKESMRLYPPVWSFSREAIEDDVLGGYQVPAGSMVVVSPYCVQRHPAFWDNPEGFEPERFTPEAMAGRPTYAYCPFGGGPRHCIGSNFALMEMQSVLRRVSRRFRLDLAPGYTVAIKPGITLRPSHGIHVRIARRNME